MILSVPTTPASVQPSHSRDFIVYHTQLLVMREVVDELAWGIISTSSQLNSLPTHLQSDQGDASQ